MSYKGFIINSIRKEDPMLLDMIKNDERELYDFMCLVIDLNILNKSRAKYNYRRIKCIKSEIEILEMNDTINVDEVLDNLKKINNLKEMLEFHEKNYAKAIRRMISSYKRYNNIKSYFNEYIKNENDNFVKIYYYLKLKINVMENKL